MSYIIKDTSDHKLKYTLDEDGKYSSLSNNSYLVLYDNELHFIRVSDSGKLLLAYCLRPWNNDDKLECNLQEFSSIVDDIIKSKGFHYLEEFLLELKFIDIRKNFIRSNTMTILKCGSVFINKNLSSFSYGTYYDSEEEPYEIQSTDGLADIVKAVSDPSTTIYCKTNDKSETTSNVVTSNSNDYKEVLENIRNSFSVSWSGWSIDSKAIDIYTLYVHLSNDTSLYSVCLEPDYNITCEEVRSTVNFKVYYDKGDDNYNISIRIDCNSRERAFSRYLYTNSYKIDNINSADIYEYIDNILGSSSFKEAVDYIESVNK